MSNMDIDDMASDVAPERCVQLHPLAIIGMSDHHTRVRAGDPSDSSSSTVVGLLFGKEQYLSNVKVIVSVIDSEEIEPIQNSNLDLNQIGRIRTKIELNQKVFPQHKVVGWYRVVDANSVLLSNASTVDANERSHNMQLIPTDADFKIHNGWMKEFQENPIFILMNSSEKEKEKSHTRQHDLTVLDVDLSSESIAKHSQASRQKLEYEEELPLALYETVVTQSGGSAFLNLEFALETFEPERIGVEQVLQSHKPAVPMNDRDNHEYVVSKGHDRKKESSELDDAEMIGNETEPSIIRPPLSAAEVHLQSAITSIEAMNARVTILLDFLQKSYLKEIPFNYSLVRQVNCLVRQIPLVITHGHPANNTPTSKEALDLYDHSIILSYAAAMTKTTNGVLSYSKKVGCLLKK